MNKIVPDLPYTEQAFEVDPHSRMQNTSKPGGLTPIVLAVLLLRQGPSFSVPVAQPLPKSYRIPPPPPGLKKERQTARPGVSISSEVGGRPY